MKFFFGHGRTQVQLHLFPSGKDWQAVLIGGDRPHIGAVVLAVPRPSLRGTGLSCDCWVSPVTAHKDHLVAQPLAEQLCLACGSTVAVSAGLHVDNASAQELEQFRDNCQAITQEAANYLRGVSGLYREQNDL